MNFSNFFIEKLAETESSLTIGSKKPVTNPFLFQDIIKVCEQENAAQNVTVLEAGKTESTLEIFAPTENVIKVSPEEFTSLTQLIASLISQNAELQPTETKHKIEDADITKLQFIVPEEKLVELTSKFIDGTSFSLIPLDEINNSSEISKQLTVSYKSGPNKLSVTLNPIKVDENYTSKVINDEFSFVNKLIVNEGLLQNIPFSSKNDSELVEKDLSLFEESVVEETVETIPIEETKTEVNEKVFYKAEIIKIETPQTNAPLNSPIISVSSNTQAELFTVNKLFQQNDKLLTDDTVIPNKNVTGQPEVLEIQKLEQLNHESETKLVENNTTAKSAEQKQSEPSILVDTTKENIAGEKPSSASLNDLMEGLTDEEKSVFRSFTANGEIKEIKYESNLKEAQTDSSIKVTAKTTESSEQKIAAETQPSVRVAEETNSGKAAPYQTAENDEALEHADVKESPNTSTKFPKQMEAVIEKSATVENTHVVESKTSANVVFENESVTEPAKTKESASTKPLENIEAVAGKHVAQEKVADENLVVKEKVTPKKEVLSNDKTITTESTKETSFKKFENRPKLVSKEEFLALKNVSQVAQPKVTVEEQTTKENISLTNDTVESATAEETSAVNKQTAQPEIEKKANEVFSEGKLLVKVSAKASIKVDKSGKDEVEAKPQNENSLSKEVKANDTEHVYLKGEKIVAETTKTVNLKNEKGEQVAANVNAEASSTTTKEKAAQVKTDAETKEQTTVHTKEVKQSSEPQTNQQSDKENSKSSSSETFKNHLTQVAPTDKNFEIENLKPQVEAKQAHEPFKTIKQQEIMPEFSKLILQGEKQTMTLQLTPENLGKVKLTVDMIENQIVTKIEVENEQVKQFVQSNIEQLKQNMQSAGVPLTNVNVSLADDQRNQKVFTQKKKSLSRDEKEDVIEETKMNVSKKKMGYNTYEFTA
ncbi:MAG: hypothetical protein FD122_755 [Stygiobacter sp.]|nr:MAG: hypothetical protein FD122_755 [Stygiobacter sp.]KAF0216471.1 MAG: hypothetical protein FD178_1172 [Ignavibacteria bacterium]